MAGINTIKESVRLCRAAGITPYIWGHRGLGKSSSILQLCNENKWGFIDLRCSQLESSDIRGLPDRGANGRTVYLPPSDIPVGDMKTEEVEAELLMTLGLKPSSADQLDEVLAKASLEMKRKYNARRQELQPRYENGILFLDEANRAQDDVSQAIFQLVLDRRIGQYVLPPGWNVVAAGNFMEGYMVGGFDDPAFLNRFCHLIMSSGETTMPEWIEYMSDKHGVYSADIIEFASQNVKHLDGDIKGDLGFVIQPSRRSWEMITWVAEACDKSEFSSQARTEVRAGLIGRELALAFEKYSCPVKPLQVINDGVAKYHNALVSLERNQLQGLMWGLVGFCKSRIHEDKIGTVCIDFAKLILTQIKDNDIVVAFCRALVSSDDPKKNKIRTATISNPGLTEMIAKIQKANGAPKTFIDRLHAEPTLQKVLSRAAWGSGEAVEAEKKEEKKKK